MTHIDIVSFILPKEVANWFDVINMIEDENANTLDIYLDEKRIVPDEIEKEQVQSYGFTQEVIIQDFPIRGKGVYLHLRKRKWLVVNTNSVVTRKFDLTHVGTQLTKEFVAFLKSANK